MAFCLGIPLRWKIHPVFHASLLTTSKETSEHSPNFLQPPLHLIDGEEEYEVKVVIGHQGKPGCRTILIRWKGYSPAEDTWEPEWNLGNAQPLITEYKIAQPNHHHKTRKWKLWMSSSLLSSSSPLSSPCLLSLAFCVTCCGILWSLTPVSNSQCLGRGNPLSPGNYKTLPQIGRTSRNSLMTA